MNMKNRKKSLDLLFLFEISIGFFRLQGKLPDSNSFEVSTVKYSFAI